MCHTELLQWGIHDNLNSTVVKTAKARFHRYTKYLVLRECESCSLMLQNILTVVIFRRNAGPFGGLVASHSHRSMRERSLSVFLKSEK